MSTIAYLEISMSVVEPVSCPISSTYQIDNHIFLERASPFGSYFGHMQNGFDIVRIDMKNRGIDDTSHVRAVRTRTSHTWIRGETDLDIYC